MNLNIASRELLNLYSTIIRYFFASGEWLFAKLPLQRILWNIFIPKIASDLSTLTVEETLVLSHAGMQALADQPSGIQESTI